MFIGAFLGYLIGSFFHAPMLGLIGGGFIGYSYKKQGSVLSSSVMRTLGWGLFGFFAGALLHLHWLGLMLGLYVGAMMGAKGRRQFQFHSYFKPMDQHHQQFIHLLFYTLGYIAKQGGQVRPQDIAYSKQCMANLDYAASEKNLAIKFFREGKTGHRPPLELFAQQQLWLLQSPHMRHVLVTLLRGYQDMNRSLNTHQARILADVYHFLGFREQRRYSRYQGRGQSHHQNHFDLDSAYQLLGISRSASKQEVKKAYRLLMAKYHPDRLMAKGLSQSEMEKYTEKAQTIQQAYQLVREAKGF